MSVHQKWLFTLFTLLAGIACAGIQCGIFETREPELPSQSSSTFIPAVTPEDVFTNIVSAFREVNSINYLRCMSDTATGGTVFQFVPTQEAHSQFPSVFQNWTRQSEQQYFDKIKSMLQTGTAPSLVLSMTRQYLQSDSALYEGTYFLYVPHTRTDLPKSAQGKAQFILRLDQSRYWAIRWWADISLRPNDTTWSDIKGNFGR